VELTLTPFQPVAFVEGIICKVDVGYGPIEQATLNITYCINGDMEQVEWPDENDAPDFHARLHHKLIDVRDLEML
jgi:hypothetical protein